MPIESAFEHQALILAIRRRWGILSWCNIDKRFHRLISVVEGMNENVLSPIPVFEAVQQYQILIAHIVYDAPNLAALFWDNIGCAAPAELRMTGDGETEVRQAANADELRRRAAPMHLLPTHIRSIGKVVQLSRSSFFSAGLYGNVTPVTSSDDAKFSSRFNRVIAESSLKGLTSQMKARDAHG